MKTKHGYLRFVKWQGRSALFREANMAEILLSVTGMYAFARVLGMKEGNVILVKSKWLPDRPRKMTSSVS